MAEARNQAHLDVSLPGPMNLHSRHLAHPAKQPIRQFILDRAVNPFFRLVYLKQLWRSSAFSNQLCVP